MVGDVRGLGLMLGSEFTGADGHPDTATAQRALREAADRGLLLLSCGPFGNVVRMIPPLVVNASQVEEAASIWAESVDAAREVPGGA